MEQWTRGLESLGVNPFWRGRRVLVTGHTGFKGSWLSLWLQRLGADVVGFALPPATTPSLFEVLFGETAAWGSIVDLTDRVATSEAVAKARPEIIVHLAAQSLVRQGYRNPQETFASNVMGTVNLLSAVRDCSSVRAIVVATTDKVYENDDEGHAFAEDDRLGGKDPYSASKACAEIASHAFRRSFFADGPTLVTARAGNVVGGGDWSEDRLVPDLVRSLKADVPVELRYPDAVRPWQHVLEPLAGYLSLAQALIERPGSLPPAMNFGPDPLSFAPVRRVVEVLADAFGIADPWRRATGDHPPEAKLLTLRSDLAERTIAWHPRLNLQDTLAWTADWYKAHRNGRDMHAFTCDQIAHYEERLTCE